MTNGILFYSNNIYPLTCFSVAAHSLVKYYDGNIHIVFGPNTPEFIYKAMDSQSRISYSKVKQRYANNSNAGTSRQEWMEKPYIISMESPFDLTLYYDCDHTFHKKIDISVFDKINEIGLVTAMGNKRPKRHDLIVKDYKSLGEGIKKYHKVNGGCIGYKKGNDNINIWINKMKQYASSKTSVLCRNSEEFGLGYVVNKHYAGRIDENFSICMNKSEINNDIKENFIGIHYVGGRWIKSNLWSECLEEAYLKNSIGLREYFDNFHYVNEMRNILKQRGVKI